MKSTKEIDKYGKYYAATPFEDKQSDFRRQHLAKRVHRLSHTRILEIGCGLAPLAAFFKDFQHMTVVEPCALFAEKARQLARKNANITVLRGFLEDYDESLQNQIFDCIIVSGVLHEVGDPKAFLARIANIAKNGAVVHVTVPNARSFHRLLALEMGLIDDIYAASAIQKKLRQPWAFDMKMLHHLATGAGFQVMAEGFYAFKPFTHAQMEKLVAQKFITKRLLEGMFNMCKYAPELGSEMFVELRLPLRQHIAQNSP